MDRILLVLVFTALISGCGFQLRGSGGYELGADSVLVIGGQRELIEELNDTLKGIGVDTQSNIAPQYTIEILNESTTRRAVATSGNITVSEYEVRLRSQFLIVAADGEVLVPETELSAERVYSFDAGNFVSNTEEEALLVDEMRQDLAGQLVRRFSATLRNKVRAQESGASS